MFDVCASEELAPGGTATLPLPDAPSGMPRSAVVLRLADGTLRAYLNLCMHLPIPLDSGRGRFFDKEGKHLLCRTHGALYRPDDGYCVEGPCQGMRLERLSVEEAGGRVRVGFPDPKR